MAKDEQIRSSDYVGYFMPKHKTQELTYIFNNPNPPGALEHYSNL